MTEAISKIKTAGASKVRSVPMAGNHVVDGLYQIEILKEGIWTAIVGGIPKNAADSMISQAVNNVLLG